MATSKARWFIVVGAVAMMSLATAAPSQAGPFDWLCPSTYAQPGPGPATFAPAYSAQRISWMPVSGTAIGCDPCGQQTSYVPEIKYRWTYSRIPKTSMQAVSSCDPATGCATTVYKPVTTYSLLPWLHQESYTAYRPVPVAAAACNPCGVNRCDPCGTNRCDSCGGTPSTFAPAGSGCSTCTVSSYESSSGGLSSDRLSPSADPGYPTGRTFAPSNSANSATEDAGTPTEPYGVRREADDEIQPIPDPTIGNPTSGSAPKLITPRGRTAALPIPVMAQVHPVSRYQPVAQVRVVSKPLAPITPVQRKLDVSGWRAVAD
jgi:hypothetical protein